MGQSSLCSPPHHITMKFYLLSLSVLCVSTAPTFNDYLDYLPASVKEFVEETQKKGTEVLGNIQEDVEKEVFSKTSEHFDKISEKMENTVKELHGVEQEFEEICVPGDQDYDISPADQKLMDEQLNEIEEDIAEDEKIGDDVERMILQQVNNFRASMLSMTKEWRGWHRSFFNSSELIVPATDIINKAAKDMKTDITDLFKTFGEIDI